MEGVVVSVDVSIDGVVLVPVGEVTDGTVAGIAVTAVVTSTEGVDFGGGVVVDAFKDVDGIAFEVVSVGLELGADTGVVEEGGKSLLSSDDTSGVEVVIEVDMGD